MTVNQLTIETSATTDLLGKIEAFRGPATKLLDPHLRRKWGQFFTPKPVAEFMATMCRGRKNNIRLLDAGAGTGILSAAMITKLLSRKKPPKSITVTAFEIDPTLHGYLDDTYILCAEMCKKRGVAFSVDIHHDDFIAYAANLTRRDFFSVDNPVFNLAIVNPPYAKINNNSENRQILRSTGIETTNLYTGFLALLAKLLEENGELVAITPRSFCNGPYFKPFRAVFLENMSIQHMHIFESRSRAFKDDEVLQENIITYATKTKRRSNRVILSTSDGAITSRIKRRLCPYEDLVSSKDAEFVIHLTTDETQANYRKDISTFTDSLADLGLNVSTGRVVDFRARHYLRDEPDKNTVPLIYSCHFNGGFINWPKSGRRKPNAIVRNANTLDLLVPNGVYVLTKRFSAKEERRRIVACIYDPARIKTDYIGFENHLNYFHSNGQGLPVNFAKGLAAYLNSTPVDSYFRQFNGHTQVNASDLKRLVYPNRSALERLGSLIGDKFPEQADLDKLIQTSLL